MTMGSDRPQESAPAAGAEKPVRSRTGVKVLVALVACCAAVFWAWRVIWDSRNPV
jgi:hypothetical protein